MSSSSPRVAETEYLIEIAKDWTVGCFASAQSSEFMLAPHRFELTGAGVQRRRVRRGSAEAVSPLAATADLSDPTVWSHTTVAMFAALGGGAYAVASNSFVATRNGATEGCLPKNGGTLRVVKVGHRCPKETVALTFDAQGRVGKAGPQGRPGAAGARGIQGPAGPMGSPGSNATVNGVAVGGALAGTFPNPQIAPRAVTSAHVADRALTLADLGGPDSTDQTTRVSTAIKVSPGCINQFVGFFNAPIGPSRGSLVGGMVIGTLTDATGAAAVDNEISIAPSMLILTNNGGTIANLILCNDNSGLETVPVGSVFHWPVIGP